MRVTVYRETPTVVGRLSDGTWVEKRGGNWVPTEPPVSLVRADRAGRPPTTPRPDELAMQPPKDRTYPAEEMVTVKRTTTKTVRRYEAEVLVRNGWEYV